MLTDFENSVFKNIIYFKLKRQFLHGGGTFYSDVINMSV